MRTSIRHRWFVPFAVTAALLAAACGDNDNNDTAGTTTTADAAATEPVYAETGPYVAGTTALDLDGRVIEVWYPAEQGAEAGVEPTVFEIRDLLPDNLKAIVPDELNPRYTTDGYPDIEASGDGPFPLVLFAHGFAAYPTEYQFLLTHLASWGFVVAAPDFEERGLVSAFLGNTERADETAVMGDTIDLLEEENERAGSVLEGVVDTTTVGTAGHSAGVGPAIGVADADERVKTFIAMSGTGGARQGEEPPPLPEKPGMVVTGGKDQVAVIARVRELYDRMRPPKRLVVVDEAGHAAFTDLCEMGKEQGGLVEIAREVGIPVPDQLARLFLDGCSEEFLPATEAWDATRHFVTAQFRYALGVDAEPVGLAPGVADAFEPVAITYLVGGEI
jgi:dienelactone hydrolase